MAIQIVIEGGSFDANGEGYLEGELVPSGNYSTNGDTVDFTGVNSSIVLGPNYTGAADLRSVPSSFLKQFDAWSEGGLLSYQYAAVRGNGQLSGAKLKVGANNTFGTELAAGGYPGAVTGDTIAFYAVFKKLL